MNLMPNELKERLRQLQEVSEKARDLNMEVITLLTEYGVNSEYLTGVNTNDRFTKALTYVTNAEGNVEKNITDIENVFLYYVNR